MSNKKYETFNIFYEKGYSLAEEIKQLTQGQIRRRKSEFCKNIYP